MIHEDDWSRTCFSPKPLALAEALCRGLREGVAPSRPAVQPEENERAWLAWHANLLREENRLPKARGSAAAVQNGFKNGGGGDPVPMRGGDKKIHRNEPSSPLVSVCVAHRDRPAYLRQAIASLEAQDYKDLEIIVVDDASTRPEALAYLDTLEPALARRGGKLIRLRQNAFPGAARNRAAREARGEYLLFMDDDNFAKPNEVTVLLQVARHTGAEIVSCFRDVFEGENPPDPRPASTLRWMFLGDALSVGVFENYFGDTNSLVRRDKFLALGGFHENWGVGNEDWEFMARAVLAGCRLEVVPEALVWYRLNRNEPTVNRTTPAHLNRLQILKPYLAAVPPALSDLLLFAQGARLKLDTLSRTAHELGMILRQQSATPPEPVSPPGIVKRAVFRLLGRKMRRSIRKRIATVSRWLLDPQTQE
jgi:glycosyltransferase involved in cell wall biosynthesis